MLCIQYKSPILKEEEGKEIQIQKKYRYKYKYEINTNTKLNKNTKETKRKLLLCIQYKSPISRWVVPEGRGQGPIHSIYVDDDLNNYYGEYLLILRTRIMRTRIMRTIIIRTRIIRTRIMRTRIMKAQYTPYMVMMITTIIL